MKNHYAMTPEQRLEMIEYAKAHTVKEASIKFNCNDRTLYRWAKKYDGTLESLQDKSSRPLNPHPSEHTEEEIQAIGGVKEIAKIIRKELKTFEGFKFSVRTEDNYYGGRINVYVLSSPYNKERQGRIYEKVEKIQNVITYGKHCIFGAFGQRICRAELSAYSRFDRQSAPRWLSD